MLRCARKKRRRTSQTNVNNLERLLKGWNESNRWQRMDVDAKTVDRQLGFTVDTPTRNTLSFTRSELSWRVNSEAWLTIKPNWQSTVYASTSMRCHRFDSFQVFLLSNGMDLVCGWVVYFLGIGPGYRAYMSMVARLCGSCGNGMQSSFRTLRKNKTDVPVLKFCQIDSKSVASQWCIVYMRWRLSFSISRRGRWSFFIRILKAD